VATLDGYAELYRLNASDLGGETSSGSQALVHVGGSDCIVSNCLLGVSGRLLYAIRVHGDGDQNVRIEDNRIAFADASGAGTWALAGVAAIYVYGGSSISRSGWIRNNHISWLTFMSTDADHPSDVHKAILLWTNVQMWTIEKNYVLTKTQAAAGGEFVICIQEPAYRGIAGGANNCIGNIAQDLGNINTPDIGDVGTPSSAVVTAGDPTNIGIQGV